MSNENHIAEDDLVLFALQFLPEAKMREARDHVKGCDECRTELAKLQGDLVAYAVTAEAAAPSASARERLLRQVAKEPKMALVEEPKAVAAPARAAKAVRGPEAKHGAETVVQTRRSSVLADTAEEESVERRRPRRAPWVLAWTGWAVALGCSFVAGWQVHQRQMIQSSVATQGAQLADLTQTNEKLTHAQTALDTLTAPDAIQMALRPVVTGPKAAAKAAANAETPEAMAAYAADKGALVFVATHLQPVASGKTYELWLLPTDPTKGPVPAGTFKPDTQGCASVVMPQLPKGVAAKGFGVTIENTGGSSTPTLPLVLSGA
ncbi:MAG TPA: anti-sigma factor [Acidobacteriaceae bacterium]|jgi:hypothetical protein|nr:anti-sigma factor [Acidobacteriaceae bacterium]